MITFLRTLTAAGIAGLLAVASPILAAPGETITDAREMAPEGLIGMWKADLDSSTFPGDKPAAMLRSFAYTEDGKVLVSFATRSAAGTVSSGHWAAQVDGTPGIEYHSSAGSVPYNVVEWKVTADGRLELDVSRYGETTIEAVYQLSDDGETLTYSYGDTVVLYRRWNMLE